MHATTICSALRANDRHYRALEWEEADEDEEVNMKDEAKEAPEE